MFTSQELVSSVFRNPRIACSAYIRLHLYRVSLEVLVTQRVSLEVLEAYRKSLDFLDAYKVSQGVLEVFRVSI